MNNKSRKYLRFWSVLLALVMALSLMPVSVFAYDEPSGDDITVTEEISEVETTVTILLPEGFTADGAYEEGEYLVVRSAVDTEDRIAPIKIIPCNEENAGSFSADLATEISGSEIFQNNNLTAVYDEADDALIIEGSPEKSVELNMNEILATPVGTPDLDETEQEIAGEQNDIMLASGADNSDNSTIYVSANGSDDKDGTSETNAVETLSAAYTKVSDGGKIILLTDITISSALAFNIAKNVTITSADAVKTIKTTVADTASDKWPFQITKGIIRFENIAIDGSKSGSGAMNINGTHSVNVTLGTGVTIRNYTTENTIIQVNTTGNAKLIIDGASITGNEVKNASADSTSIIFVGSANTVEMNSGSITGNTTSLGIVTVGQSSNPKFYMNGGEIKNNTMGTSAGAVYMRGKAGDCTIRFSGSAYVYDNKDSSGNQRNVYLKNTAVDDANTYVSIGGALNEGAKLGVYAQYIGEGTVIAKGVSDYTATSNDATHFLSDRETSAGIVFDETAKTVKLSTAAAGYTVKISTMTGVTYDESKGALTQSGIGVNDIDFSEVVLKSDTNYVSMTQAQATAINSTLSGTGLTASYDNGTVKISGTPTESVTLNLADVITGDNTPKLGEAKIGDTTYATLVEAFEAANKTGGTTGAVSHPATIIMIGNPSAMTSASLPSGDKLQDTKGNTYEAKSGAANVTAYTDGTVTLNTGKLEVTGDNSTGATGVAVGVAISGGQKASVLVPAGESITLSVSDGTATVGDGKSVTIDGVTFTAASGVSSSFKLNVTSGKLTNTGDKATVPAGKTATLALGDGTSAPVVTVPKTNTNDDVTIEKTSTGGTVTVAAKGDTFKVGNKTYTAPYDSAVYTIDANGNVTITIDPDKLTGDYALNPDESVIIGNYIYTAPTGGAQGDVTITSRTGMTPAVTLKKVDTKINVAFASDKTKNTDYTAVTANTKFAMSITGDETGVPANTTKIDLLDNGETTESANSQIKVPNGVTVAGKSNAITSAADNTKIGFDSDKNAKLIDGAGKTTGKMTAVISGLAEDKTFEAVTPQSGTAPSYTVDTANKSLTLNDNGSVKMDDKVTFIGNSGDSFGLGSGEGGNTTATIPNGASVTGSDGVTITGTTPSKDATKVEIDKNTGKLTLIDGTGVVAGEATVNTKFTVTEDGHSVTKTVEVQVPANTTATIDMDRVPPIVKGLGEGKSVTIDGITYTAKEDESSFPLDKGTLTTDGDKAVIPSDTTEDKSVTLGSDDDAPKVTIPSGNTGNVTIIKGSGENPSTVTLSKGDKFTVGDEANAKTYTAGGNDGETATFTIDDSGNVSIETGSAVLSDGDSVIGGGSGKTIVNPADSIGDKITVTAGENNDTVTLPNNGGNVTIDGKDYEANTDNTKIVVGNKGNVLTDGSVKIGDGTSITGKSGQVITNPNGSGSDQITIEADTDTNKDTVTIPTTGDKVKIGGDDYTEYTAAEDDTKIEVTDEGNKITKGAVELDKDEQINVGDDNTLVINTGDESITVKANVDESGNPDGTGNVKIPQGRAAKIKKAEIESNKGETSIDIGTDGKLTVTVDKPGEVTIDGVTYTDDGSGEDPVKLIVDSETGKVTGVEGKVKTNIPEDKLKDEGFSYEINPGETVTVGKYTYTAPTGVAKGDVTIKSRGKDEGGNVLNPEVVIKNENGTVDVSLAKDANTKTTYTATTGNTMFAMSKDDTDTTKIDLLDNGDTTGSANSQIKVPNSVAVAGKSNAITSAADNTKIGLDSEKNAKLIGGAGKTTGKMTAAISGLAGDKTFEAATPESGTAPSYTVDTANKSLTLNDNGSVKMDDQVTFTGKSGDSFGLDAGSDNNTTATIQNGASVTGSDGVTITGTKPGTGKDATKVEIDKTTGMLTLIDGAGVVAGEATVNTKFTVTEDGHSVTKTVEVQVPANTTATIDMDNLPPVVKGLGEGKSVTIDGITYTAKEDESSFPLDKGTLTTDGDEAVIPDSTTEDKSVTLGNGESAPKVTIPSGNAGDVVIIKGSGENPSTVTLSKGDKFTVGDGANAKTYTAGGDDETSTFTIDDSGNVSIETGSAVLNDGDSVIGGGSGKTIENPADSIGDNITVTAGESQDVVTLPNKDGKVTIDGKDYEANKDNTKIVVDKDGSKLTEGSVKIGDGTSITGKSGQVITNPNGSGNDQITIEADANTNKDTVTIPTTGGKATIGGTNGVEYTAAANNTTIEVVDNGNKLTGGAVKVGDDVTVAGASNAITSAAANTVIGLDSSKNAKLVSGKGTTAGAMTAAIADVGEKSFNGNGTSYTVDTAGKKLTLGANGSVKMDDQVTFTGKSDDSFGLDAGSDNNTTATIPNGASVTGSDDVTITGTTPSKDATKIEIDTTTGKLTLVDGAGVVAGEATVNTKFAVKDGGQDVTKTVEVKVPANTTATIDMDNVPPIVKGLGEGKSVTIDGITYTAKKDESSFPLDKGTLTTDGDKAVVPGSTTEDKSVTLGSDDGAPKVTILGKNAGDVTIIKGSGKNPSTITLGKGDKFIVGDGANAKTYTAGGDDETSTFTIDDSGNVSIETGSAVLNDGDSVIGGGSGKTIENPADSIGDNITVTAGESQDVVTLPNKDGKVTIDGKDYEANKDNTKIVVDKDGSKLTEGSVKIGDGTSITGKSGQIITNPADSDNNQITIEADADANKDTITIPTTGGKVKIGGEDGTEYTAAEDDTKIEVTDNGSKLTSGAVKVGDGVIVAGASNAITSAAADTVIGLDSSKNAKLVSGKGTTDGAMTAAIADMGKKSFNSNGTSYTVDTANKSLTLNDNGSVKMDDKVTFTGNSGDSFNLDTTSDGNTTATISGGASVTGSDGVTITGTTSSKDATKVEIDKTTGNLTLVDGAGVVAGEATVNTKFTVTEDGHSVTKTVEVKVPTSTTATIDMDKVPPVVKGFGVGQSVTIDGITYTAAKGDGNFPLDKGTLTTDGDKAVIPDSTTEDKSVTLGSSESAPKVTIPRKNAGDATITKGKPSTVTLGKAGDEFTVGDGANAKTYIAGNDGAIFTVDDSGNVSIKTGSAVLSDGDSVIGGGSGKKTENPAGSKDDKILVTAGENNDTVTLPNKGGKATIDGSDYEADKDNTKIVVSKDGSKLTDGSVKIGDGTSITGKSGQIITNPNGSGSDQITIEADTDTNKDTVTIPTTGGKATIGGENGTEYTTAEDDTKIEVTDEGNKITKGAVELDKDEQINVGDDNTPVINTGDEPITAKANVDDSGNPDGTGNVKIPQGRAAKIKNAKIESNKGETSIDIGTDGKLTVTVDKPGEVTIDGVTYTDDGSGEDPVKLIVDPETGKVTGAEGKVKTNIPEEKLKDEGFFYELNFGETVIVGKYTYTAPTGVAKGDVTIKSRGKDEGGNALNPAVVIKNENDTVDVSLKDDANTKTTYTAVTGKTIFVMSADDTDTTKIDLLDNGGKAGENSSIAIPDGTTVTGGSGKEITNPAGSGNDKLVVSFNNPEADKDTVTVPTKGGKVKIGDTEYETAADNTKIIVGKDGNMLVEGAVKFGDDESIIGCSGQVITNPAGTGNNQITVTANSPKAGMDTVKVPANGKVKIGDTEYTAGPNGVTLVVGKDGKVTVAEGALKSEDEQSDGKIDTNSGKSSPSTGDDTNIALWAFAILVAALGITAATKKKHNK